MFLSYIKVLCIAQNHITIEFILQIHEDLSIQVDSENTDFHATGTCTSVAEVRRLRLSYQQSIQASKGFAAHNTTVTTIIGNCGAIAYVLVRIAYLNFQLILLVCY